MRISTCQTITGTLIRAHTVTKQSQGLDIHNFICLGILALPHVNEHHPLHAKDTPRKIIQVICIIFFLNSDINLLAWVQSAVKNWWAWEVSHEVNGTATACMQIYHTRQGFYMLSDCSHPTEPHPTQWLFTPHCSVQMPPFPLYVLGNLTEKN